ncbi:MAG TPA: T9SS type A sorting domain-containing protein, partial [Cytophagales bacterium]|nr:T9SS type A sorting domain-containing protein [Cytophagales bacterium]
DSDSPFKYESCGLIKNSKTTGRSPRLGWYWVYTMRNTLKRFKFNSKPVSGNANVMIQQYTHSTSTDSLAYVLWCPTSNSTVVSTYNLQLPAGVVSAVRITPTAGSIKGTATNLTITNNTVTVKVTEDPIYILVKKGAPTGFIETPLENTSFSIYPNPVVNDEVNIESQKQIESVEVMDIKGVKVLSQKSIKANTTILNVSHLSPGFYTVEVVEANTGKIVNSKLSIIK